MATSFPESQIGITHLSFGEYRPLQKRQRDRSGETAWRSAYGHALREFYGEHRIPPFDLFDELLTGGTWQGPNGWEEWRERTMQRLDDWQFPYYSMPPFDNDITCFITPPREDMGAWYIEVGHDKGHTDLLTIPWEMYPELFFRPKNREYHTDQTMRDTFFAPLLKHIRASRLDMNRITMTISFADNQGFHSAQLPSFLQTLDLLNCKKSLRLLRPLRE